MQQNKLCILFLLFIFLAGTVELAGQQSRSFRLSKGQILSSTAHSNSANFKLLGSNLGAFCPGEARSQHFKLNSGFAGSTMVDSPSFFDLLPQEYQLQQNFPNPFNPTTTIRYSLLKASPLTIRIYNAVGQLVWELNEPLKSPGSYQLIWNGRDLQGLPVPSGIYLYQISTEDFSAVKRMILVK